MQRVAFWVEIDLQLTHTVVNALYGQTHKYSITICYSRFLASSRCQCRHCGAANRLYRHPLECFNGDGASCSETYIINLVVRSKRTHTRSGLMDSHQQLNVNAEIPRDEDDSLIK